MGFGFGFGGFVFVGLRVGVDHGTIFADCQMDKIKQNGKRGPNRPVFYPHCWRRGERREGRERERGEVGGVGGKIDCAIVEERCRIWGR